MAKGRLLSVEEVNGLKDGQVVYMEPIKTYPEDIGKGKITITNYGIEEKSENDRESVEWILSWGDDVCDPYSEFDQRERIKIYEWKEDVEMKTFKTSEMIAMLEGNPKLKFQAIDGNRSPKVQTVSITEESMGYLAWDYRGISQFAINENALKAIWILIKPEPKEVTFMDAIKAFDEGKTIYCKTEGAGEIQYKRIDGYGEYQSMEDDDGDSITQTEILEGKWYIEVGEEC